MSKEERPLFWLVAVIGLVSCILYGGDLFGKSEQMPRAKYCEQWANLAVEMYRDKQTGAQINVSPNLEKFKAMVWKFEGTEDELREQVLTDCMFVRT